MGELETEVQQTRDVIATTLRDFADQLEADGTVTLELGARAVRLDPTEPVTFKLEGESDWSEGETQTKESIEFELVWWRDAETAAEARLDVSESEASD
jgi:amphi-Trp domain-containing protein